MQISGFRVDLVQLFGEPVKFLRFRAEELGQHGCAAQQLGRHPGKQLKAGIFLGEKSKSHAGRTGLAAPWCTGGRGKILTGPRISDAGCGGRVLGPDPGTWPRGSSRGRIRRGKVTVPDRERLSAEGRSKRLRVEARGFRSPTPISVFYARSGMSTRLPMATGHCEDRHSRVSRVRPGATRRRNAPGPRR